MQDSLKISGIQNDHLTTWPGSKRRKTQMHREAICFQNDRISIDIWFLSPGRDITYGEVVTILGAEQIPFEEILDEYRGYLIRFKSGVTMDFDDRSGLWLIDRNGKMKHNKDVIMTLEKQLLNGIRLFDFA